MANDPSTRPAGPDRSRGRIVLIVLAIMAVALLALEPLVERKGYFEIEKTFGFYAIVGVVTALVLVVAGGILGAVTAPGDRDD